MFYNILTIQFGLCTILYSLYSLYSIKTIIDSLYKCTLDKLFHCMPFFMKHQLWPFNVFENRPLQQLKCEYGLGVSQTQMSPRTPILGQFVFVQEQFWSLNIVLKSRKSKTIILSVISLHRSNI